MISNEENYEDSMIGRRVGVYELKREIGRGGMGAVYLASRVDGEFRQTVAIKLIKRGMDTDLILKRFRRERQIIAALDHPNITYFLAGGSTEDGLPYFVMEYIDGKPLYRFCDENKLSINERLEIFRQICDAVETAHKNKVIHRDLKPSNILVKADGTPKLLDFGIAKVLDPELAVTDIDPTATSMRVMTPEYASPEQVSGDEITPASDIYSLGIILYELLTGHRPYRLKRRVPHEIARIICEEMPSRPSGNLTGEDNLVPITDKEKTTLDFIFDARNSSLNELQKTLSGELDKIVLKTLRKKPSERYESAAALAEDITNFLENRPVNAETFAPEKKKQSNKKSVAILPLKIIGAAASKNTEDIFLGIGLADALVSRLSGVQRLIVRPTSSVLPFAEENPLEAGKKTNVDFVLDGTIRRIGERIRVTVQLLNVAEDATVWAEKFDEKFTDVLEIEDVISEKVARVLLPQLTGKEKRRLEKRGTNNAEAYQAYLRGRYFANQFTDESLLKAIESYEEAIRLDPNYALPHVGIADFYIWSVIFGKIPSKEGFPKAKQAIENALKIDNLLGEAFALLSFITLLYDWDWAEAERLVKRALELNPNYYFAHEAYSAFFVSQGIFKEGREEIVRAEELDPLSPRAKLMTSWIFYQTREFPKALEKAQQANEMQKDFAQGFLHLGNTLSPNGKTKEAVEVLRKSVSFWEKSGMPLYLLCFALVEDGRIEEARKVLNEILEIAEREFMMPYYIAAAYTAVGDFDNAFKWFEKAVEDKNVWLIWFGTEPKFDEFRKDARYLEILKRTNNPLVARLETGETTGETEVQKSIAVLPFKILTSANKGNEEDEYLSIGLADALTMRLSNIKRFLVRPTSSVLTFGSPETEPFFAGRELGVDFVIDGNIRRVGDRIRVAAQLLNVGENSTNWAARFDEKYTDVLALEDSISERVTKCLLPKLTGEEQRKIGKRGTNSPEAFDAYMQARYYWNQFTPESFRKTIIALEKAVEYDPNYALAFAGIADFYNWAAIYGFFSTFESAPKVFAAANRALEIDDSLAEAYAALGLHYSALLEYEKAEQFYLRAIELAPNYPLAHEWLGSLLTGTGRFDEGVREVEIAEQLDPFSLRAKTLTAWTTYQARDFEAAVKKGREIIELDKNYPQGYLQTANNLIELGQFREAVEMSEKALETMGDSSIPFYMYCFALVADGQTEKAREIIGKTVERSKTQYVPPYFLGMSHVAIGEIDAAFPYFEKAFEEKNHWLLWFGTEIKLDAIRGDERYFELFGKMNNPLIEKQKAEIKIKNEKKSIAFLPFNLIGESSEEDEFLGIGLADALTTRFSNIRNFIVRPTSSVLPFAIEKTDPFAAGKNLAVEYIVEGNIRRVGERIRVSVQLLDVENEATDWSFPFDEKYTDVLTIEDSISEQVAKSLLPQLSGADMRRLEKRGTDNAEAYEAFLRGRYYLNSMNEENLRKAVGFFEQAIALDADYALAYISLAEMYIYFGIQCMMPFSESSRKAKMAAEKALAIDPMLAEAQASLGFTFLTSERDWETAAKYFRRALQINPDSRLAHFWMETYYLQMRRFDDALGAARKVLESEPNSMLGWHLLAWIYYHSGQFDKSVAAHAQMLVAPSLYAFGYFTYSWALRLQGDFSGAIREAQSAISVAPGNPMYQTALAAAYAAAGKLAEAEKELNDILAQISEKYLSPYLLATIYQSLNDTEKTFELLKEAAETGDAWVNWFVVDPQFAPLREDERGVKFMQMLNYPLLEK